MGTNRCPVPIHGQEERHRGASPRAACHPAGRPVAAYRGRVAGHALPAISPKKSPDPLEKSSTWALIGVRYRFREFPRLSGASAQMCEIGDVRWRGLASARGSPSAAAATLPNREDCRGLERRLSGDKLTTLATFRNPVASSVALSGPSRSVCVIQVAAWKGSRRPPPRGHLGNGRPEVTTEAVYLPPPLEEAERARIATDLAPTLA